MDGCSGYEHLTVAVTPGELVVAVVVAGVVDVEVDAVEHGVAEGAGGVAGVGGGDAAAGEVGVPEVGGEGGGGLWCGEGVVAGGGGGPADGEENEDALGLAVLDVVSDAGERVARDVERVGRRRESAAEAGEEGDEDGVVGAGVAGLTEGALASVPAPEHGDVARASGGAGERPHCEHREEDEDALPGRHCGVDKA
nr:unnamed protein product [Digitaria exilis]